jgi:2'-5' RNA ligase
MPRLFTAFEVPQTETLQLAFLRGGLQGARWIDPENYHVTLRFAGDIDDRTARDWAQMLDGVRSEPVEIAVSDLDVFGGSRPRAIIARVRQTPALEELQAEHERLARRVGLPPETRRFTPHITLARLRDVAPRNVADWLASRGGEVRFSFTARRFVLLSSRASVGGGPYVVEEAYPLDGAHVLEGTEDDDVWQDDD